MLNWYRNGQDSMGWHADNEKELGDYPAIVSINIGAARKFVLRKNTNHKEKIEFILQHGDLLLMHGDTQNHWQHQVPKQKKVTQGRINLTFRKIIT